MEKKVLSVTRTLVSDSPQTRSSMENNPEEIDENERYFDKRTPLKSQHPKKSTKNFMSPTISATSKMASPRKVLTERNETIGHGFSDTHIERTPKNSREDAESICQNLESLSYDPLKNYLSPRPRFLRYNPNRRLKRYPRRERELNEELGINGKFSSERKESTLQKNETLSSGAGFSLHKEEGFRRSAKELNSEQSDSQETEESDEDEGNFDEESEEKSWSAGRVLKPLFVLCLVVFAFFYISSTNPSPMSAYIQSLDGFGEGFLEIHDPLPQFSKIQFEKFSKQIRRISKGFLSSMGGSICSNPLQNVSLVDVEISIAPPAVTNGYVGGFQFLDFPGRVEWEDQMSNETVYGEGNIKLGFGFVYDFNRRIDSKEQESVENDSLMVPEAGLVVQTGGEMKKDDSASEYWLAQEHSQYQNLVDAYGETIDGGLIEEQMGERVTATSVENITDHGCGTEIPTSETAGLSGSSQIPQKEFVSYSPADTLMVSKSIPVNQFLSDASRQTQCMMRSMPEILFDESEDQSKKSEIGGTTESVDTECKRIAPKIEYMEIKTTSKAALGFSILLVIVAATTLGSFCVKPKKTSEKHSSPSTVIQKHTPTSPIMEKMKSSFQKKLDTAEENDSCLNPSSLIHYEADYFKEIYHRRPPMVELFGKQTPTSPIMEKAKSSFQKKLDTAEENDSCLNPSSLIHYGADNFKEIYHRRPPMVELLGEYEVGELSSSEKGSPLKSNASTLGGENKSLRRKSNSSCGTDASLSGKRLTRKQEGEDGIATTPIQKKGSRKQEGEDGGTSVRRSSRIKNRVIMSP